MRETTGIRFKESGKIYYFNPGNLSLKINNKVIVNTEKGYQLGFVATKKKENKKDFLGTHVKKILRVATKQDLAVHNKNLKDSKAAHKDCELLIKKNNLKMKLLETSYTFDRKQLIFSFTSEERVDFRNLVKELAKLYRTRIELRQLGIRDQAKTIGGIGPCGRPLCCTSFLNEFKSVSINMAKNQNLALNPTKISGLCGRLLCCLNYEDKEYKKYKKGLPRIGEIVKTEKGKGRVISINLFGRSYRVDIKDYGVFEVLLEKDKNGSN